MLDARMGGTLGYHFLFPVSCFFALVACFVLLLRLLHARGVFVLFFSLDSYPNLLALYIITTSYYC
jgi:hypothetical protein